MLVKKMTESTTVALADFEKRKKIVKRVLEAETKFLKQSAEDNVTDLLDQLSPDEYAEEVAKYYK